MRSDDRLLQACPRALVKSGAAALAFGLGILAAAWSTGAGARAAPDGASAHARGPRFESLKADHVPLRNGPGREFPISWVLSRAGLPVEVLREVEGWRQVRDADGTTGWVPASLLSARRTALVLAPKSKPAQGELQAFALRGAASDAAPVKGLVETGRVLLIAQCDGAWCQVASENLKGHIDQRHLWGVYPGERVR